MDDFVAELVGYVESEGTVSVINFPLLLITQDAVSVIDLLELKGKNDTYIVNFLSRSTNRETLC